MVSHRKRYVVYADGACIGNPGPGGWGVVIAEPLDARSEFSGGPYPGTTNNRMEITAAIEALRALESGAQAVLRTDSKYVVATMTQGWKRNANRELWDELDREVENHAVSFEWVAGHAGNHWNERADRLARAAAEGHTAPADQAGAAGESAAFPPRPRVVGAMQTAREEDAARKLAPSLHHGESIRRCATCGRLFVSPLPEESCCSLVGCQLTARRKD